MPDTPFATVSVPRTFLRGTVAPLAQMALVSEQICAHLQGGLQLLMRWILKCSAVLQPEPRGTV